MSGDLCDRLNGVGEHARWPPQAITSLLRALSGFLISVVLIVPLGLVVGSYARLGNLLNQFIEICRNTAPLALLPVFILLLGIGELSKITMVVYSCAWPLLLNMFYGWATFTYEDGSVVPGAASKGGRSAIARALLQGPVYARLDKAGNDVQRHMRVSQPNFFLPFDRTGIDPFRDRFPVTLRLEGTVRGTGGLRIVDDNCATSVPGLYAAGDAATRELICGGFTGGGSHNAAWAMSSGPGRGRAPLTMPDSLARSPSGGCHLQELSRFETGRGAHLNRQLWPRQCRTRSFRMN